MSILSKLYPYVLATKGYCQSLFTCNSDDGVTTGEVDFVVTWVDGNDPRWQAEKGKYDGILPGNGACRYRDWISFRYWFRAVEKYAPWVRYVYLVTWGHLPPWINTLSPKLKIVRHEDFIPSEYLPTFNCNPIELNLHRIPGLSENFVYFNDDVLLAMPLQKTDFFINGQPVYPALSEPLFGRGNMVSYHIFFSTFSEINGKHSVCASMKEHPEKWFSNCYGKAILKNIAAYKSDCFSGIILTHAGIPLTKSTFSKVWDNYPPVDETCRNRFRTPMDMAVFLVMAENLMNGHFVPVSPNGISRCINLDDFKEIKKSFNTRCTQMVCFNDSNHYGEGLIDTINRELDEILGAVFPEKSAFEK